MSPGIKNLLSGSEASVTSEVYKKTGWPCEALVGMDFIGRTIKNLFN